MFKNYLTIALRNIVRNKTYSFINISGLAVGMAACLLILLYVEHELSYDRFHEKSSQIYRVVYQSPGHFYMGRDHVAVTSAPLAPALMNEFPEVIHATRIYKQSLFGRGELLSYEDKRFYENRFYWGDANIFNVFSFPLVRGNPETALQEPHSIVISEKMASKYFGDQEPLGRVLTYDNKHDFIITGIMKDVPDNSHLQFDFLASFSFLQEINKYIDNWGNKSYYTYVLLDKNTSRVEFEKKISTLVEKYRGEDFRSENRTPLIYYLQSLSSIHLQSHLNFEIEPTANIQQIYLFVVIGFIILIIGCINYMNLSTARSVNRAREVSLRKVAGAQRHQLIWQFIGESLILSLIALFLAAVLVELFLPIFNSFIDKNIQSKYFDNPEYLITLLGLGIVVGLIAGSYPAFFISSFKPATVLKGELKSGSKGTLFRNILVVAQFLTSIIFIISTIIIYKQTEYIKYKNLGFNREQVIVIPFRHASISGNPESIKNELLRNPNIRGVTFSSWLPNNIKTLRGPITWEGKDEDAKIDFYHVEVDHDFIDMFEIELAEGRNFSKEYSTDRQEYILNETALERIGWETALDKQFGLGGSEVGSVIGVVNDFHFHSLHFEIEPLMITLGEWQSYISVKTYIHNISETINYLETTWKKYLPEHPIEYFFLDDDFEKMYQSEIRLAKAFRYFTFLAIIIASFGLFCLASFTTEQRTKEIGIRKVAGASVGQIVGLLCKEFIILVLIANVIAWPVAWYAMSRWLENFAYRIDLGLGTFILAGLLALVIALATVSYQAIKAATANPVEALRYE